MAERDSATIDIKGDASGAQAATEQAKASLDSLKTSAESTGESVAGIGAKAAIGIGTIAAAAILGFISKIEEARSSVANLENEFQQIGLKFAKSLQDFTQKRSSSGLDREIEIVRQRTSEQLDALNDDVNKRLAQFRQENFGSKIMRAVFGGATAEDVEREAAEATRVINNAAKASENSAKKRKEDADAEAAQKEQDRIDELFRRREEKEAEGASKEEERIYELFLERERREDEARKRREEKDVESAQRVAEAMARALEKSLSDVIVRANADLSQAINQNNSRLTVSLDNLSRYLQLIYGNQPSGGGR